MPENEQNVMVTMPQMSQPSNTISLLDAVLILWKNKFKLLVFVLVGAAIGLLVGFWIRPQYTSDALLQIDVKGNKAGKAMGEMGVLLEVANPADAEIELIKSRMVLGYVVETEHLCYSAVPTGIKSRLLHREGRMDIERLSLPRMAQKGWEAEIVGTDEYKLISPSGDAVADGHMGEMVTAPYAGDTAKIIVRYFHGTVGERFALTMRNPLHVMRSLASSLTVVEKGKQTGMIAVKYSHRYPDRAAAILNAIANTYVRQNVEMRSAEAEKTLEFLESQLPGVKQKLDSAEKVLTDYRHRIGSVDMTGETQAHLDKQVDLQRQLLQLEQDRQQATRLFKKEHPTVQTIIKQEQQVRAELGRLRKRAEKMPVNQQEVLRLQEEVQVNNAIYTTMLNNIQQLHVVQAGEVGNVRVVDFAQIEPIQSKPNKTNILLCSVAAAFMIGVLLVFLQRMLRNGVRSTTQLEHETEISVYAKVAESHHKLLHNKRWKKRALVEYAPNERASESFRSLQTALDFSLKEKQKVVMVCGLLPNVGKSFVSKNLSTVYALSGKRVLLIDADMRKGVLRSPRHKGLSEVLSGKAKWQDLVVDTPCRNLFILGRGGQVSAPSELFRTESFGQILEEMKSQYDMILVDTPPLSLVTDSELIYPHVDFTLMVLQYGMHSMDQIKESITNLKRYGNKELAFVMNRCEYDSTNSYGYNYYYGGYYSDKKSSPQK